MAENIGHVRGAIVNPRTGQPTKLFYDILARISSDTETVIREQFPWSLSIEANQVVEPSGFTATSTTVAEPSIQLVQQSADTKEWYKRVATSDVTSGDYCMYMLAQNVTLRLPPTPSVDSEVIVIARDDGPITVSGNGNKIKVRSDTSDSVRWATAGKSINFHWFEDGPYWVAI